MPIKFKNNVSSTLASAISASDVGLTVAAGTGAQFPTLAAGDYFYATLITPNGTTEVVKVTARAGDSMTVVRAQEGSSAAGFAAGTRMELRVTAQAVTDFVADPVVVTATGTGSQTIFAIFARPTAVYISGVYQNKNTYTFAGGNVTFSEAPPSTSVIEFLVYG
jgi:hypothetical protein